MFIKPDTILLLLLNEREREIEISYVFLFSLIHRVDLTHGPTFAFFFIMSAQ